MKNSPGGLLRPYSGLFSELFRIIDVGIVVGTLYLLNLLNDVPFDQKYMIMALAAALCFFFVAQLGTLYGSWRVAGVEPELKRLLLVWIGVVFLLLLLAYGTKVSATYSRRVFLTWIVVTPVFLAGLRVVLRVILRNLRVTGRNLRTVAIAGGGELADKVKSIIETSPWLGLKLVGVFDGVGQGHSEMEAESISDLINRAKHKEVDVVFMVMSMAHQDQIETLTAELADTTTSLYYIPSFFMTDLLHSRWGYLDDIPYLSLRESPFYGVDGTLKRLEDIILASLILILISIPMLFIAISIKLGSRGPVLFRQHRYGLDGQPIEVWKFRTMSVMEDGDDVPQAQPGDSRLTPNGAFLRRTSLDELPQFFNVLAGSMSIVGPRPHAVAHNEEYRKLIYGYMLRHKVKPGITGWAQVNGWRGQTDTIDKMEKRVEHDMWYIRNWSLWLDLKIVFFTIIHGFTGKNAY